MSDVTIIKRNTAGQATYRYKGKLVHRDEEKIVLEAFFDRRDISIQGMVLQRNDRFVETYFTNRWYNIFEIHAWEDDRLRGWYCNIGFPVEVSGDEISYIDLALDLLVFPDGRQFVLDEDEFAMLDITAEIRDRARSALEQLQAEFQQKFVPN